MSEERVAMGVVEAIERIFISAPPPATGALNVLAAIDAAGWVVVPKEPTEEMWTGWRSVNCTIGGPGMEEFTYFSGDYGNWLACWQAALAAGSGRSEP